MYRLRRKSKCPCGSGKEYRKCHEVKGKKKNKEDNHWKGPGYDQSIYFGDEDKFNGVQFPQKQKGEICLTTNTDTIPLGRYMGCPDKYESCHMVIQKLNLFEDEAHITLSGNIMFTTSSKTTLPVFIGVETLDDILSFSAMSSGEAARYEEGNWLIFLNMPNPPFQTLTTKPSWFRYFTCNGFLVEIPPNTQLQFNIKANANRRSIFSIVAPYGRVELPRPQIQTRMPITSCRIDLEGEHIYWDLILHKHMFSKEVEDKPYSKIIKSKSKGNTVYWDTFRKNARQVNEGPVKIVLKIELENKTMTQEQDFKNLSQFPGTVIFIAIKDVDKYELSTIFCSVVELNKQIEESVLDKGIIKLSTISGAIIIYPDSIQREIYTSLELLISGCFEEGLPIRLGVAHGMLTAVSDADEFLNFIGPAMNIAARLANSERNNSCLFHETYVQIAAGSLVKDGLHPERGEQIEIPGKPHDKPFKCVSVNSSKYDFLEKLEQGKLQTHTPENSISRGLALGRVCKLKSTPRSKKSSTLPKTSQVAFRIS